VRVRARGPRPRAPVLRAAVHARPPLRSRAVATAVHDAAILKHPRDAVLRRQQGRRRRPRPRPRRRELRGTVVVEHVHAPSARAAGVEHAAVQRGEAPPGALRSFHVRVVGAIPRRRWTVHGAESVRRARFSARSERTPQEVHALARSERRRGVERARARAGAEQRRDSSRTRRAPIEILPVARRARGPVAPRAVPDFGGVRRRSIARERDDRVEGAAVPELQVRRASVAGRDVAGV
jgi:hypothetical protein